jgi:hypothetical protein
MVIPVQSPVTHQFDACAVISAVSMRSTFAPVIHVGHVLIVQQQTHIGYQSPYITTHTH